MFFAWRTSVYAALGLLLLPIISVSAQSSGGGYTLHGQANPVGWISQGGWYTIETGGASINKVSSGNNYTLIGGAFRSQYTADVDNDGVDNDAENLGLNGGDGNDDGIQDSAQPHVVTIAGDNTTHAVALEVTSASCATLTAFSDKIESMISTDDSGYTYPIGLLDFHLGCSSIGDSASVRIFFDADYSAVSGSWIFRKWDGSSWSTVSPQPTLWSYTFTAGPMVGQTVTTAVYGLIDGGVNDSDHLADATIVDPIGPGVAISTPITPSTGGGGGGGKKIISIKNPLNSAPVCSQNTQWGWYRRCEIGSGLSAFKEFADNIACEWFIAHRNKTDEYEFTKNTPRKEALAIAVKMKRVNGTSISLLAPDAYTRSITDIFYDDQTDWVPSIVETALANGLISRERMEFEPNRLITRAEAYAMIMSSVCLVVPESQKATYATWQEWAYDIAQANGLTTRTWQTFEPQKSILRQELFVLASRAADWAEKTGGCDPKPASCLRLDAASEIVQPLNVSPETLVDTRVQQPGTFVYLYDTEYHQVYSYIVKSGGIPDGVRQAYIRTFWGSEVTANRLSIRDITGTYYAEDRWFMPNQVVYVYLRKASE